VKRILSIFLKYLSCAGGPLFLVATVAYGLQNLVNTELMILLYVYALLGLAIYVPMILTDQVSLAYAAYAGIGGYSVAILSSRSLEALWGVLLGMVLAGLTAYLVALATRKLSGYFLAVGTLLVAVAFGRFLLQQPDLTGGADGLNFRREILSIPLSRTALLVAGAVMIWGIAVLIQNLKRSDVGKGLFLMGGSRPAAESIGLNTLRFRTLSLVLGAAIASLAERPRIQQVVLRFVPLELAFLILFIRENRLRGAPRGNGARYVLENHSFGGQITGGRGFGLCLGHSGHHERLGALLSVIEQGQCSLSGFSFCFLDAGVHQGSAELSKKWTEGSVKLKKNG
jgi:branched-chain amino acid transport system permease protein